MTIELTLASFLAQMCESPARMNYEGNTVGEVLNRVTKDYPTLGKALWTDPGKLNPVMVVYRNDTQINQLSGLETPLSEGDEVIIISGFEGG